MFIVSICCVRGGTKVKENSRSLHWCFAVIKKRLWVIALITVLSVIICNTIGQSSKTKTKSEYEVSTTLLVKEPKVYTKDQMELSYDEYQAINKSIMNHFSNLIKMEVVVDEVIDEFQLDMDYEEFRDKMDVETISNSNMLKVQIKNEDIELAGKIVDELVTVSSEKADEILGIKNIEIIDRTQANIVPTKSTKKQDILLSAILGVLVSLLVVFLLEYMDKTIKSLKDIEYYLDLPAIKIIEGSNVENTLVMCQQPDSLSAETYRNAITNIRLMQREKDVKTLLFTSPTKSRAKSRIIINIAMALSRTGKKVLLIDGDLRESNISNFFGMHDDMGLANIVIDKADLNDVIQRSKTEENLHILPSGKISSHPGNLLALEDMKSLLAKAKDSYDVTFIDSPPLNIVADAIILSTISNGTMLICETGATKIEDMKSGQKKLERVNSNILGVLLKTKDLKEYEYVDIY